MNYLDNIKKHFMEQSKEYEHYELIARQRGKFDEAFMFQEYAKQTKDGSPAETVRGYVY